MLAYPAGGRRGEAETLPLRRESRESSEWELCQLFRARRRAIEPIDVLVTAR